jgi:hypothetical protein
LPLEINTQKNLECDRLGERYQGKIGVCTGLHGILPLQEQYKDVFEDIVVNGKLVFYKKGLIFVDSKAHAMVLPYEHLDKLNFYVGAKDWWLEILP